MKSWSVYILTVLFCLIITNGTHAQTTQKQLNQVMLMKQFSGIWKGELGKRTVYINKNKPFGTGMACTVQVLSNGIIVDSVKQLFGYHKKTDKYIIAELVKSTSSIGIGSVWFTSEHSGKLMITYKDGAEITFDFEFLSPGLLKQTAKLEHGIDLELIYNRIKTENSKD